MKLTAPCPSPHNQTYLAMLAAAIANPMHDLCKAPNDVPAAAPAAAASHDIAGDRPPCPVSAFATLPPGTCAHKPDVDTPRSLQALDFFADTQLQEKRSPPWGAPPSRCFCDSGTTIGGGDEASLPPAQPSPSCHLHRAAAVKALALLLADAIASSCAAYNSHFASPHTPSLQVPATHQTGRPPLANSRSAPASNPVISPSLFVSPSTTPGSMANRSTTPASDRATPLSYYLSPSTTPGSMANTSTTPVSTRATPPGLSYFLYLSPSTPGSSLEGGSPDALAGAGLAAPALALCDEASATASVFSRAQAQVRARLSVLPSFPPACTLVRLINSPLPLAHARCTCSLGSRSRTHWRAALRISTPHRV